ncbi:pyridoxamine 5'-phosphate oxidase [Aridibaculum aurantiacum]|uniref:pyridoxamine 5'-phosphate oxidase n=1 Tax=Aridibaculum aurantiacum TaxID=2810307 RepID=UPI001A961DA4|nr:pyridoxamine 5'-phosphate oxidase [Aridibaculum aurantiacum]
MKSIADIRKDYKLRSLMEQDVQKDPIQQFSTWWDEAVESKLDEVNAMTLATSTTDGHPSTRIVLLKGFTNEGFIFFTNYQSRKGTEIGLNPNVSLLFFWRELERQVIIEGKAEKISEADSDAYFHSRPEGSRIGAWSSPQSTIIAGRHVIEENVQKYTEQFADGNIPRPPHWGGFIVRPVRMEFWQGRSSRLHDRLVFTLTGNEWLVQRLAP